jgi:hypothetical protein
MVNVCDVILQHLPCLIPPRLRSQLRMLHTISSSVELRCVWKSLNTWSLYTPF